MRQEFLIVAIGLPIIIGISGLIYPNILWSLVIIGPILLLGLYDYFQVNHTILRNFPILGHFRYMFEAIRPEINQYFIESNTNGVPFSREDRSVVYERAKNRLDTLPFGTQKNLYEVGYEWTNHSILAIHPKGHDIRVTVGCDECKQPYSASLLNISAMSYGALSQNAVLALNGGAKDGNFAHNTGEGGLSPYHLEPGGDLIWQVGTGYFGCRTHEGEFSAENFQERATLPNVKMIEIKLSQGAKPGHGGILPAAKVSKEISEIRGVPMRRDVLSPPSHTAFKTPVEMMQFIAQLRELSGGKPIGFKLCVGKRREFLAICKAMEKTGITPDFITVDGGEGGTGAAPLEFSNHMGSPGSEALIFVHNALIGFSIRDRIRILSSGKVTTGFGMVKKLALGADAVYSARGMMLALGCIQALRCNANVCPTGITTQDPNLVAGLVVTDKRERVSMFHKNTMESLAEILGAMGLEGPEELRPWHIMRRVSPTQTKHYGELYDYIGAGSLISDSPPPTYERALRAATPDSFRHVADLQKG